jgi:UDP-N-acetylmuramoylalanine--D-glutamate ligase
MKEGELAIIPKEFKDMIRSDAFICYYENSQDIADFFDIDISKLKFKEPFLMDALMALSVSKSLFNEIDYNLINSFVIDKHKMQELTDKFGHKWIDDSKATNVSATIECIKNFKDKNIYLILGGDSKDANLTPLFKELKDYNIELFLIGKDANKFEKLAIKNGIKYFMCGFLDIAVEKILQRMFDKDGIGILSPASASKDQFSSYKQRGELFQKLIAQLKNGEKK